ncbi:MAG: DUF6884 domain-containing protein, partial [Bacteroidota bacterium]
MSPTASAKPRSVLLCSANRKAPQPAPAIELYRSEFFRLGRSYAWSLEPQQLFILSALHGLVPADQELKPYAETMSELGRGEVGLWADGIVQALAEQIHLPQHEVIVLGLRRFAAPILKQLPHGQAPLVGMTMPQALNWLRA